jgi:hypothetical protein
MVVNADMPDEPSGATHRARWRRRPSDKVLSAFHQACDQADFEVAEQLLHILEMVQTRRSLTPTATDGAIWTAWSRRMSGLGLCGIRMRKDADPCPAKTY